MSYITKHLRKGFVEIFKAILREIADNGLKEGDVLTVTFSTDSPQVIVPERIKWPNEMKIYFSEGLFEELKVFDTFFEAIFYFDGKEEHLKIPYIFVKKAEDVDNKFELNLEFDEDTNFYITEENIINIDFEKKK